MSGKFSGAGVESREGKPAGCYFERPGIGICFREAVTCRMSSDISLRLLSAHSE